MSKARPRVEVAGAVLVLLAFAASAFRLLGLGFYDDDWAWISLLSNSADQSLPGLIRHFASVHGGVWSRPLNFPVFAALYKVFGAWTTGYHLTLAALTAWGAVALWRWLEEEGLGRPTAVLAAGLFLLWPNHDATRHWCALYSAPAALALTFEALRLRKRSPILAAHALVIGGLMYEASSLLAAVPFVVDAWRARRLGPLRAFAAGLLASAPLLAGLFLLVLWQRVLCPLFLFPERHPMTLSPLHALGVFRAGLECSVLNRLWHLIWTHAVWARSAFSLWDWAAWALAASGLAVLVRGVLPDEAPPSDAPVFAAAIFLLGYLPYVFDATYTPAIFSATNRVNFTASAGAALLAAWALRRAFASARPASRAAGAAIAAVLPAALLLSTWVSNAQWAEAATRQGKILSGLNRKLDALPPGKKTVLLFDLETFVGSAPVFNSTYDLDGALSYVRRDPDLRALVAEGRVSFGAKNATMNWFGATEISYEGLYAYRANAGLIARIANKADGETFLNAR